MRKQWLGICIAAGMLAACTSDDGQQQTVSVPQPAVCNGPIVEISGADPRFDPLSSAKFVNRINTTDFSCCNNYWIYFAIFFNRCNNY